MQFIVSWYASMRIVTKIIIVQVVVIILSVSIILALSIIPINERSRKMAEQELRTINNQIINMIDLYNQQLKNDVVVMRKLLKYLSTNKGLEMTLEEIDRFTGMTGNVATVFVREGDDFRRIRTSLKKEDGSRASGTLMGKEHPAYKLLMDGKSYIGKAVLFENYYMTMYEPVIGQTGVEGAIFIGLNFTEVLKSMKEKIRSIKIAESGYTYVISSAKGQEGLLAVHPAQEGTNILESKDANGKYFIKEIIEKKEGVIYYPWINKALSESMQRDKMAVYNEYPEWNWVLGSGSYTDEIFENTRYFFTIFVSGMLLMALILIICIVVISTKFISKPVKHLISNFDRFSSGYLQIDSPKIIKNTNDEPTILLNKLIEYIEKIRSVINKLRMTSVDLASSSEELSSTAQSLATSAQSESSSSEEMSASIEEISAGMENTSTLANDQHRDLTGLMMLMTDMTKIINETNLTVQDETDMLDTIVIESKKSTEELHLMNETIEKIRSSSQTMVNIIRIINDISEKINMLSVNAAIEAARAGDRGKGFAVVAEEVSKLADKTTISVKEIDTLIKINNKDISNGVSKIESVISSIEKMNKNITNIKALSSEIAKNMSQQVDRNVHVNSKALNVRERAEKIKFITEEQKKTIEDIVKAMSHLAEISQLNASASEQISANSDNTARMADDLHTSIEFFKE